MNEYRTMGDVRQAAREYGMTLEQFFFETEPERFEGVDWNNDEPSESLRDRLSRLNYEMQVISKYGQAVPERLMNEYDETLEKWVEEYSKEWERVRAALEEAPNDIEAF